MKRCRTQLGLVGSLALPLLIFTGCQPDAKTEERLKNVELRQEKMRGELLELNQLTQELSKTTREALTASMAGNAEIRSNALKALDLMWDLQADMEAVRATNAMLLGARARAVQARPMATMPASSVYTQTRDGVPIGIYNQIATDAARRYPTDYDMQAFVIKEQIAAYRKLHP